MDKSNNLPDFLPETPPTERVLDFYGLFSPDEANILENQAQHLSFKPRIIVLPKDYGGESLPTLSTKIATAWNVKGDDFLLVLDMNQRQLFGKAGSKLESEGITDSYISDRLLADNFYQAAQDGNISGALFGTLQALNIRIVSNRTATKAEGSRTLSYTTQNSEGAQASYDMTWVAVLFFVAVVVSLAVISWFGGKHKTTVANMKRARERDAEHMKRLEAFSREKPKEYLMRVLLLALLGYAYIWFVMALILLGAGFSLLLMMKFPFAAIKLGIPMVLAFWLVARSFWIKMPPVEGIRLNKHDFPELFEMIEETRIQIKAPKIDEVVLTEDLNAAVVQMPRLGLLGWNKNYLIIGLSLLQVFSVEEFRAVLAHEMGHLAKSHGASIAWIAGIQRVWARLMEQLTAEEHFATGLFRNFFYWYIPFCNTYTFPLCREQEYIADQCSIDLVGKEMAARALIGTCVKDNYLSRKYWSKFTEDWKDVSAPPAAAFSNMAVSLKGGIKEFDAEAWLKEELRAKTDFTDTHPCLTDRLASVMGIPKEQVADFAMSKLLEASRSPDPSAAQELLGAKLEELARQIDESWRIKVQPIWEEKHATAQQFKKELEELETKAQSEELTGEELLVLATRTYQLKTIEDARPIFEKAVEKTPEDAVLREEFGRALLNEKDEQCVGHLKFVMEKERLRRFDCAQMLCAWYKMNGEDEEAEKYYEIIDHCIEEIIESQKERAAVTESDLFLEHGFEHGDLDGLIEGLANCPGLERVFIVKKEVKIFPEAPLYVMVIDGQGWGNDAKTNEYNCIQGLVQSGLFNVFPAIPIAMRDAPKRLKTYVRSEPSALVFERAKVAK